MVGTRRVSNSESEETLRTGSGLMVSPSGKGLCRVEDPDSHKEEDVPVDRVAILGGDRD